MMSYIKKIQTGESINLTSHNKVVAQLRPPSTAQADAMAQLDKIAQESQLGDVIAPIDSDWNADPADRIILATTLVRNAKLITADKNLLDFQQVNTVW